jgi:uncharacterized membrane protein YqjE
MSDHVPHGDGNVGQTVQDVTDRVTLLIREEIELAKAEITQKVSTLIKGAVVGMTAGLFIVVGLLFLLHGAAWAFYDFVFNEISFGYFIVAGILFILGALAGWLATRALKRAAPPAPTMAIAEAQKIRETLTSPSASAEATRSGQDVELHPAKQTEANR